MFSKIEGKMKNLILDINRINENDSIDDFLKVTDFSVTMGMDNYLSSGLEGGAFLLTDNISARNKAVIKGIGMAAYLGEGVDPSQFPEALYCIDSLKDMTDEAFMRMYERAEGIPWTVFETERCYVREITTEDVLRLYEIYSDKETKRYIEDLYDDYEKEVQFTKDYILNQYRFYEYGLWIVILKETGEVIGRAGIFDRENQENTEIGFVFDKKYWGKGIATEILTAISDYARKEFGIETLVAHVMNGNLRSKALLTKLGYSYIGEESIDGKVYDTYSMLLVNSSHV